MNSVLPQGEWGESPSAEKTLVSQSGAVFESLFARSADAIWLYDPEIGMLVDCNDAAIRLIGAERKDQIMPARPEDLSPAAQMDGSRTADKSVEVVATVQRQSTYRFEWVIRRRNGPEVPLEVSSTAVELGGKRVHVVISRDISERIEAERKLRELTHALERRVAERTAELTQSEARFRAMVEHAPGAIVVYSADTGRFLFGNQHACDLYGVPMERLAELTPMDVSPEYQHDGRLTTEVAREKVAEVLAGQKAVFEWTHRRPDGRLVPTEVRLLHLPAEGQNLIRASIIDNTQRKHAERALRESEAKFRALFERSSHGVVLHDEKEILEVNPAAIRIMRRSCAEELVGRHPGELAPTFQPGGQRSDELSREYLEECITRGSTQFEWTASSPRGEEIPLEVTLSRIEWSGRAVIQALITDITERRRAQVALTESEARFSAAFRGSPLFLGILRVSDQKYVLVNESYLNWLGAREEEVIGRTCFELGLWENPADREAVLRDMLALGSIRQREYRWKNRQGQLSTVLLSAETIMLNNTPHMISMVVDITQRKRAEEELSKTLEREKELSELKSSFVSMVSHEFRTPLGIIHSSGELLRDFYERMVPAEREEQLASIIRNARRMAGMMEEILVLSRLDAGKLDFKPVEIDFSAFCRRMVDETLSATNRRCRIELSSESIPPRAKADERLLGHIFGNLLSNAVKYSEPDAVVRLSIRREGSDVVCVVQDHGIGISLEDQQQLFTAFHRGSNVGSRPGTGLGLLLVKRCADLHAGRIELQSALGQGTAVTVRLSVFEGMR